MAGLNLGKQYGPLPLGGWIAVIIGGLGIGYFINRSQGGSSSDNPPSEEELSGGESSGAGGGQFIYDPPTGVPTPDSTAITDNLTWATQAKNYLKALPGVDAVQAGNAIERYLSGMSLSVAERALVNLAIARFGNPPEGVTPVDDKPPPTDGTNTPKPKPKPKPVPKAVYAITMTQKTSTVRRGAPASFAGKFTKNGKGTSSVLLVERRKPNSTTWTPHSADGSNTTGSWGVITSFGSPGTWGLRVRHSTSGKSVSTTVRVT